MGHVRGRQHQPSQPHWVLRRTRMACALGRIVLGTAAASPALVLPLSAHAQSSSAPAARAYDIPAGTLEDTLSRFGRDAGIMLSFKPEVTAGRHSSGLKGTYTPRNGLEALVAGTGVEVVPQSNGSFLIQPATHAGVADTAAMLPTTHVTATYDNGLQPAYAGGQIARGGSLGILGSSDAMDVPFSTMNYTEQMVRDQQARTLADVVINESSVRMLTSSGGFGEDFQIRGYTVSSSDVGLNGLYGMASASRVPAAIVERVEVLKGPGTLMNGIGPSGSIGGAINVVTKRAGTEPLTRLTTTFQSKAQLGVEADVGRRFGEQQQWGIRVNGVYRNGKTTLDDGKQNVGFGSVGLDYTGQRLRWSLDAYTQHEGTDNFRPQVGFQSSVTKIPDAPSGYRNFYPGSELHLHDSAVTTRLEYDVLRNVTVWGAVGYHYATAYQTFPIGGADSLGNMNVTNSYYDSYTRSRTADVGARANFKTFGIGHTVTVQASRLEQDSGNAYVPGTTSVASNIYNPVPLPPVGAARTEPKKASESALTSFAITDTLSFLNDRVLLTGGLRQQRVALDNFNTTSGALSSSYDQSAVSPLAGIVVKPLQNVSVYANFTSGLSRGGVAPVGTVNAGQVFPPFKSKQYEAGVKADWGTVTTMVSVFQVQRPNSVTDPATRVYSFDGEQRNRGIELSAYGEVMKGLRLMASATFYDAKLTKTAGGVNDGNDANGVPKRAFNFGVDWDTPWVQGLSLSGRIINTSRMYFNAANTLELPAWTRYDIGARYRTRVAGKSVVFRANIENLFNSNYWLMSGTYATVAAPRTVLLSAQIDF
ncbi:Ferrichrome receptor FcuA [Pandoraea iniqua]|uniref:TonB-dependent receptor n=1 Tax=Pandoraea iniqua TaxID=2508288 RepID=UPI001240AB7D|nr:TonB-dependent receptor [Pandoraea iniqua]VVD93964.1 Ferrichrome receptor FcuA [Pandoraea iniqua]